MKRQDSFRNMNSNTNSYEKEKDIFIKQYREERKKKK